MMMLHFTGEEKKMRFHGLEPIPHIPLAVKLFLCYLMLVITMFVFINTYGVHTMQDAIVKDTEARLHKICAALAQRVQGEDYFYGDDGQTARADAGFLSDLHADMRIWLADRDGTVFYDSGRPDCSGESIRSYEQDFLEQTAIHNTIAGGMLREPACAVIYPIVEDFEYVGYVIAIYPLRLLFNQAVSYMDIYNICFLFFCVVLAVIFYVLYVVLVKPLHKNIRAIQMFLKGNYDYQQNIHTRDEYEELAYSVAFLAGELKKLDDYQKKFIANVSHDFRSPLTSIKGYAEAMADGTIPPQMQGKYLEIIVYETNRLAKLAQNLLSLDHYNQGVLLNIQPFNINEAIRHTALSFEGTGRKKGIHINLLFEEQELFVKADKEKIEQVLYNLLDNAIKFSDDGKEIRIMTKVKGNKAMISIKDSGIGIPKDAIPRVFDRFYKTDLSRGKDKKGTGLGLAIVKDIITEHKEHITVVSTQGAGTEFTFSLPLSADRGKNAADPK